MPVRENFQNVFLSFLQKSNMKMYLAESSIIEDNQFQLRRCHRPATKTDEICKHIEKKL